MPERIPLENGAYGRMRGRRLTDEDPDQAAFVVYQSRGHEDVVVLRAAPYNESSFSSGIVKSCSNLVVHRKHRFDRSDIRWFAPQDPSFFVEKVHTVCENFRLKEQIMQCRPGRNLSPRAVFFQSLQAVNKTGQLSHRLQPFDTAREQTGEFLANR